MQQAALSSRQTCLFCPVTLGPKERLEHPILDSIGGRLTSRKLICSTCNERLGAEIDAPLATAMDWYRHVLRVRSGSGDPPPTLRRIETEYGVMDLGPAGGTLSRSKMGQPSPQPGGGTEVSINARNIEDAARQTAHSARRIGIKSTDELLRRIKLPSNLAVRKRPFTQPVSHKVSLGDPLHMRAIAKTAFEILALDQPDVARSENLSELAQYVAHGAATSDLVAWTFEPAMELPFTNEELGEFAHSVTVWGNEGGPLVARVTFFGHLSFLVRLADAWVGAPYAMAYAVDPLAERSRGFRQPRAMPPRLAYDAFDAKALDLAFLNKYFSDFAQKADRAQRWRYVPWMINAALDPFYKRWGGTETTPEKVAEAAALLGKAIVASREGLEDPVDRDDFLALVVRCFEQLAAED